jgi:hypothetical protein
MEKTASPRNALTGHLVAVVTGAAVLSLAFTGVVLLIVAGRSINRALGTPVSGWAPRSEQASEPKHPRSSYY